MKFTEFYETIVCSSFTSSLLLLFITRKYASVLNFKKEHKKLLSCNHEKHIQILIAIPIRNGKK